MNMLGKQLREIVLKEREHLRMIEESESESSPLPGKWSAKQILGHLIDSASNNHQRFIRAQFKDDMIFPGYQQDKWVEVQQYQNANWLDLIELWCQFNLHLAQVIDCIPAENLNKMRDKHNLHMIAWKKIPQNESTTLKYFIADYIDHLEHHLRQILS